MKKHPQALEPFLRPNIGWMSLVTSIISNLSPCTPLHLLCCDECRIRSWYTIDPAMGVMHRDHRQRGQLLSKRWITRCHMNSVANSDSVAMPGWWESFTLHILQSESGFHVQSDQTVTCYNDGLPQGNNMLRGAFRNTFIFIRWFVIWTHGSKADAESINTPTHSSDALHLRQAVLGKQCWEHFTLSRRANDLQPC